MSRCGPPRILGLVAVAAAVLCIMSVVVLTLLLPGNSAYSSGGGYLPLPAPAAAR